MNGGALDKHQLAGLDNKERGFSRPVEFERVEEGYRAILRYETVRVTTERHPSQDDALAILNRDRDSKVCAKALDALEAHTLALAELPAEL